LLDVLVEACTEGWAFEKAAAFVTFFEVVRAAAQTKWESATIKALAARVEIALRNKSCKRFLE
jgi:hypothetical protein